MPQVAPAPASITVADIAVDESDSFFDPQISNDVNNIWVDFFLTNRYAKDGHKYMMGIASPSGFLGNSAAFVQLTAATLLWICDWTSCRTNTQPDIPDPNAVDPSWILLDDWYEPESVVTDPDGVTVHYRISGTYIYGKRNPSALTINDINFGRSPWLSDTFAAGRNMPVTKLNSNLSVNLGGPGGPGPAAGPGVPGGNKLG